jgi:putative hydrolase of the HAD superfamily
MTLKAVCFDLDDTLYDYHEYASAGLRSAARVLEERTGQDCTDELLELYFEEDLTDDTFDHLLERHDLPGELVPDLIEAYHDATTSLEPYTRTDPLLEELSENYRLGLLTDGRGGHDKLGRLDIREYFDAVLVTPTIGREKDNVDVFERLLSELSVSPAAAAYVGDDPRVDFRVPNALGMRTIRLRRGRYVDLEPETDAATPDVEIDDLGELQEHLDRVQSPA